VNRKRDETCFDVDTFKITKFHNVCSHDVRVKGEMLVAAEMDTWKPILNCKKLYI
jgi:hypothetical protein